MGQIKNIKLHIVTDIKVNKSQNTYFNKCIGVDLFETQEQVWTITAAIVPAQEFVKDSLRLVKRCTKPDRKEFQKIAMATAIGFSIMGFIGFFVKLIHIPINNIIVQ